MCHILDDFLRVALNEVEADTKLGQILSLCNLIGGPIVVAKTKKGSCLLFIGIELDSKTATTGKARISCETFPDQI